MTNMYSLQMAEKVSGTKTNDQLEPTVFVIFGGASDLTWRKLVPALFDLSQDRSLPAQCAIIAMGCARSERWKSTLRCGSSD